MSRDIPSPSADERARLGALRELMLLDTPEELAYDDLTRLASGTLGAPIALITLVDADRQWFKSRVGLQVQQTPREHSFCAHAITQPERIMVVTDASADARFAENPLVTGDPHIRFYAGAPLQLADGHTVGTLCVIDTEPREPSERQLEDLRFLARQVIALLEQRRAQRAPG